MTDTKQPRNAPLALELNGYQVDALADWARIDGEYMRKADTLDLAAQQLLSDRREIMALSLAAYILPTLQQIDPDSDLAAAIRERSEDYNHYRANKPEAEHGEQ